MSVNLITQAEHNTLISGGWIDQGEASKKTIRGKVYYRHTYSREIRCSDRCCRITCYASAILMTIPLCCQCCEINTICTEGDWAKDHTFTEYYCGNACCCEGADKIERYVFNESETRRLQVQDCQRLGFNSVSRESRMEFYDQNLSKFSCYMGHQFYCYIGPASHASEFLFVPNRQKDQITSITLYHKETGKSLSMAELQKGVKKYCENWRGQESEPAAHYPKEAIRDEEWKRGQGERKPLLSGSQQAAGVVSAQPTQVQVTVGDFVFTQITLTEDE